MPKLRDFNIGDQVTLKGACIEKVRALFIGKIEDGYRYLYRSEQDFKEGKFWEHVAAGSHQAEAA